jgi:hypothetical protein
MPKSGKRPLTKRARQRAKRERAALRMVRRSVEQQVRLAFAKVPKEAVALGQTRLDIRASLVSQGFLTVEELESLSRKEAVAIAVRRVNEQMRSDPRR